MLNNIFKIIKYEKILNLVKLIIMTLVGAILEAVGVSLIFPVLSIAMNMDVIQSNKYINAIYLFFNFDNYINFIITLAFILILFYIFKAIYMILMYKFQYSFVYRNMYNNTKYVLKTYLNKPYIYYVQNNIAKVQRTIFDDVSRTWIAINSFIQMVTEILVSSALVIVILAIDIKLSLTIGTVMLVVLFFVKIAIKPTLVNIGIQRQQENQEKLKWMNQSIYGIKEIKIARKESFFADKFDVHNYNVSKMEEKFNTLNVMPKILVECASMCIIVFVLIYMCINSKDFQTQIPVLVAFATAAMRLLPSVNKINSNVVTLAYYSASVKTIAEMIDYKNELEYDSNQEKMKFEDKIEIKNISFQYPGSEKKILDNISFDIDKGDFVGVVGSSGSGKTTLIDLVMGLIEVGSGEICVDGASIYDNLSGWFKNIGYIPQDIYLMDDTIENNIIFGNYEISNIKERLEQVLRETQLLDFVNQLPDGVKTIIGDRGARLSGGQKQRIGIARALFNNPDVLVFDEATSALDIETEKDVMQAINSFKGKKTMIIIAHRLVTTQNCNKIIEVNDGKVVLY